MRSYCKYKVNLKSGTVSLFHSLVTTLWYILLAISYFSVVFIRHHKCIVPVLLQFTTQFFFFIEIFCHVLCCQNIESLICTTALNCLIVSLLLCIFTYQLLYLSLQQFEYSPSNITINLIENRRILEFDCYFAHLFWYPLFNSLQYHSLLFRVWFSHKIHLEINAIFLLRRGQNNFMQLTVIFEVPFLPIIDPHHWSFDLTASLNWIYYVLCSILFVSKTVVYVVCHPPNKQQLLVCCLLWEDLTECTVGFFEIFGSLNLLTLG